MADFAKLVLDADTRGLKSAERDLDGISRSASDTANKVSSSMSALGKGMTIGLTLPLGLFAKGAAKAAIDAQELQSMFDTTFGAMSKTMNKWAENTGNAMGRSTQEMQESVAVFQGFFKDMLPEDEAARFSQMMTVLSQDVASFKNLTNDDAQRRLFAAVTGEYESLKGLGVVINDTVMKAKAMEMGFGNSTSALTEQEKVLVRVKLLQEKFADASGDVIRTQDSTANRIKKAQAAFEELQVTIGTKLLPAITPLVEKLGAVLDWFTQLPEPIQNTAIMIGGLAAAIGPLLYVLAPLIGFISGVGSAAAIAAGGAGVGGLAAFKVGLIALAPYIVAFGAAAYVIYKNWDEVAAVFTDIGRGLGLLKTDFQITTEALGGSIEAFSAKAVEVGHLTEQSAKRIQDGLREMGRGGAVDPALTTEITELVYQMEQAGQISGEQAAEIRANIVKAWTTEDITRQKSGWELMGEDLLSFSNKMQKFADDFDAYNARTAASARENGTTIQARFQQIWQSFLVFHNKLQSTGDSIRSALSSLGSTISGLATSAIASVNSMVSGIGSAILGRLSAIWDRAKAKVQEVRETFFNLWDKVTRRSYIPDMVTEIGEHMRRLQTEMVDPARQSTASAADAFRQLQGGVSALLDTLFPKIARRNLYLSQVDLLNESLRKGAIDAQLYAEGMAAARASYFDADMGERSGVSEELLNTGSFAQAMSEKDISDALGRITGAANDNANGVQAANVRIVESFKNMATQTIGAIQGMANAIKGGSFLDILGAAVGLFTQLGSTGLFGKTIAGNINASSFGGARANGGPVSLGKSYLVGERGPEMFTPGASGRITANDNMGGGRSEVVIRLGPGLEADLLQKSAGQTVQIVQATAPGFMNAASARTRRDAARPITPGGSIG